MDASEICLRLSHSNGSFLDIVEKDIAFTKIWIQTVGSVPSLITAPIIGSWSDRHGRKYPLLFVLASFFLFNMMHFMATATFESMNIYIWYFASEVLIGMTGGVMSLFIMTLAMVTDDCRAKLQPVLKVKRPGYTRCCILLSLIFVFFEYLAFDSHLILLYVKRPPFSWSDRLYSNFHLAESILTTIGMVLCPFLLSFVDWLGKDNLMIISGLAASAVSFFVIAFAHSTAEIFATVLLYLLVGAISPAYRSFLPRMVKQDETARLLTVLSIIMGFCPPISAFIFNNLFNYSLSFWAGFPFFVAGILVVLVVIGQIAIHLLMRPQWKLDRLQKVQKAGSHITLEYRSKAKDSFGDLEKANRNVSK
ncbi:hypothetical protein WR25_05368 [Diploscapter pachys]|uniref:Major facilitator superfamily (MFS) profile domain-containing protein n=1 Tax=Diploscapter pachys TaxID=2018661 RepID=A0A2A2K9X9_9BILA|nr:hypothetical protein WR25_05368 [Diploscapter pachys]